MDFIREIIFGELEPLELHENECPESLSEETTEIFVENENAKDNPVEPLPDVPPEAIEDNLQLVESPPKGICVLHESWREKYNRLKCQGEDEYTESSCSNKTDERKAEEKFHKAEKHFTTLFNALFSDWEEYEASVTQICDEYETSLDTLEGNLSKDEEKFINSTDFSNEGSEVSDEEQTRNGQNFDTNRNGVESLEYELGQPEENLPKVLEENEILKAKLKELEKEKEMRKTEEEEERKRFLGQLDDTLNAEMSRIKAVFQNLMTENLKVLEDNDQLKAKFEEREEQIMFLYHKLEEDQDDYQTLLLEKNNLYVEKKLIKSKLKSLERQNEILSKECEDLEVKLKEKLVQNDKNNIEYKEKLGCFLKNMDLFKAATEERLETKVKRLEDRNLKLSKENHDLRCRILDKSLHGIMAKSETENKETPQSPQS